MYDRCLARTNSARQSSTAWEFPFRKPQSMPAKAPGVAFKARVCRQALLIVLAAATRQTRSCDSCEVLGGQARTSDLLGRMSNTLTAMTKKNSERLPTTMCALPLLVPNWS
jgi:hypothetical protein